MKMMTYNIHKGLSLFGTRLVVHDIKNAIHDIDSDLVFLQEVTGESQKLKNRHPSWPEQGQHEFLADSRWSHHAYSQARTDRNAHFGNAILSRFPIIRNEQFDLTTIPFERRSLLYCEIRPPGWSVGVHCLCVHLSLLEYGRLRQYERIAEIIAENLPKDEPIILAGDFNDWNAAANQFLTEPLGLVEIFHEHHGDHAVSYPATMPFLQLDRIYVRGLQVAGATVHDGDFWHQLSDHVPLTVEFQPHTIAK